MSATHKSMLQLVRGLAAVVVTTSVLVLSASSRSSIADASSDGSCAASQLAVAVASSSGAYFAVGNVGTPFVIINISKSSCTLEGYPKLTTYPDTYKHNKVRLFSGGGMIFVAVQPKAVTIAPGSTASFGVDYADAYNQQDPNAGPCMTKHMMV